MPGHFPAPFPDEALYSTCARYGERVRYRQSRHLSRDLFGSENAAAVFDLPSYLANFVSGLAENDVYTVDSIIREQTLLPYYAPFAEPKNFIKSKEQMIFSRGSGIHSRLGLMASRVKAPERLRYCHLCAEENGREFGSLYWHRSHHLPGTYVCWKHREVLTESEFRLTGASDAREFAPADRIKIVSPAADFTETHREMLGKIACLSNKLLCLNQSPLGKDTLTGKYSRFLLERDFISYRGGLRAKSLVAAFKDFYPENLLKFLGCEFSGKDIAEDNWLLRMLRKPQSVQHPLYHVLLIIFLDVGLDELFDSSGELSPFGEGPWLCLNPAAKHYMKPVVRDFQPGSRMRNGKPIGTFKCKCGFHYKRSGPDNNAEDKYRIDKMVEYGKVWEARLTELWKSEEFNLSEVARFLKVDCLTVKRYAEKMHLPYARSNRNYKELKSEDTLKTGEPKVERDSVASLKRENWLAVTGLNPEMDLKTLRNNHAALYSWLRRNDEVWLKENLPQKKEISKPIVPSVDWAARDKQLAASIQQAGDSIFALDDFPNRITKTLLGKEAGCLQLVLTKIDKLPQTRKNLKLLVESAETFTLRKIEWVLKNYEPSSRISAKWQIIIKSGAYPFLNNPKIYNAIRAALNIKIL